MVAADDSTPPNSTDDRHQVPFDDGCPTEEIVRAVAAETGTDPLELSPLYGVVDPDALEALFAHVQSAESADLTATSLSFRYEGHDVTVRGDGRITLRPLD